MFFFSFEALSPRLALPYRWRPLLRLALRFLHASLASHLSSVSYSFPEFLRSELRLAFPFGVASSSPDCLNSAWYTLTTLTRCTAVISQKSPGAMPLAAAELIGLRRYGLLYMLIHCHLHSTLNNQSRVLQSFEYNVYVLVLQSLFTKDVDILIHCIGPLTPSALSLTR